MTTKTNRYKYWAFISYSHQDNRETRLDGTRGCIPWASWLQKAIETYRIPEALRKNKSLDPAPLPERFHPVFRDEDELAVGSNLSERIRSALDQSQHLIVLCSPRSAVSSYVNEEVEHFKQMGREGDILTLIIDGEPNVEFAGINALDTSIECFCPALRHSTTGRTSHDGSPKGSSLPLSGDLRLRNEGRAREVRAADLKSAQTLLNIALLRLIAGMGKVGFDELVQRDQQRQRAHARRRFGLVTCVAATMTLLALFAWRQMRIALSKELTVHQTLAQSYFRRAHELTKTGKGAEALAYLAGSIRQDATSVAAGRRALFMLQELPWYVPHPLIVPAGYELQDMRLDTNGSVCLLAIKDRVVALFDDKGQFWLRPLSFPSAPSSAKFIDDTDAYVVTLSGRQDSYWSTRTPTPLEKSAILGTNNEREDAIFAKLLIDPVFHKTEAELTPDKIDLFCVSPSGNLAALKWEYTHKVSMYDARTGKPIHENLEVQHAATGMRFAPDDRTLVVFGGSSMEFIRYGTLEVIQVDSGVIQMLEMNDPVMGVAFLSDSESFIVWDWSMQLSVWTTLGRRIQVLPTSGEWWLPRMDRRIFSIGRRFISNGSHYERIGDVLISRGKHEDSSDAPILESETAAPASRTTTKQPKLAEIRPSGSLIGKDVFVRTAGSSEWRLFLPTEGSKSLDLHPDGRRLLVGNPWSFQLWDAVEAEPLSTALRAEYEEVEARFSPDGSFFVTSAAGGATGFGEFQVWDTETALPLSEPISGDTICGINGGILGNWKLTSSNRLFFTAGLYEADTRSNYVVFAVPSVEEKVPAWFAEFLEVIGGMRLDSMGLTPKLVPIAERMVSLKRIKAMLKNNTAKSTWHLAAQWLTEEFENQRCSPFSRMKIRELEANRAELKSP